VLDLSFVVSLVESLLELELELGAGAEDVSLEDGAAELDEDEDGVAVEPEPAEPLIVELDEELPGVADEPLLMSTEVEDELEPEGAVLGVADVPPADDEDEPAGARVEPEGAVVLELELERSAARSQAAINEAPSARETATAIVESLMRPPWLGYKVLGSKYRAAIVKPLVNRRPFQFFEVGCASLLWGPDASSLCRKSRCWSASFGSTCPCVGLAPSRFSDALGEPFAEEVVPAVVVEPLADEGVADDVSVFGDGGVVSDRLQPASRPSEIATASVKTFISSLRLSWSPGGLCNRCTIPAP